MTIESRLAVCEQRIKEAEEDIRMLHIMLEGPPRDESVRGRLHRLEANNAAANAATAAVEAVKLVKQQKFTRGEKLIGLVISGCFLALQTFTLIVLVQHHVP